MRWAEKNFGKIWADQMASDCYGVKLISAVKRYVENINQSKFYQFELFSVYEDSRWIPMEDRIHKETVYSLYPYEKALDYITSWELKNA
jgi:hypothetical protein